MEDFVEVDQGDFLVEYVLWLEEALRTVALAVDVPVPVTPKGMFPKRMQLVPPDGAQALKEVKALRAEFHELSRWTRTQVKEQVEDEIFSAVQEFGHHVEAVARANGLGYARIVRDAHGRILGVVKGEPAGGDEMVKIDRPEL